MTSHWNETAEILERLEQLQLSGRRSALATVVRIAGSAYRRPGAKLLVEEAGDTMGAISGGCLEADVREVAKHVLASGEAQLRCYDMRADETVLWGLGLGCAGEVDVFVQPVGPAFAPVLARWRELLRADAAFAVATAIDAAAGSHATCLIEQAGNGSGHCTLGPPAIAEAIWSAGRRLLADGDSGVHSVIERTVFFEILRPPRHVLVIGAGDDAMPLVEYAAESGFRVTVADHRPGLLSAGRFPAACSVVHARPDDPEVALPMAGALAVVKTHSFLHDREWARRLLAAGAAYIGLLGPRRRGEAIRRDVGAEHDPRWFGPIKLDIGTDGSRQIAISIVAELLAFTARRPPRHLSEREEAIHAD